MYHSITISGKNLYDEWGLIPTSRPLVNPPEVKTTYVKNPGSDGSLDFTDNLTGEVQYSSRNGSWEFWIRPEDQWADIYSSVMNYLHGIEHDVILEDDPSSIYHGRLSISSWKSDKHNSLLVIDYQLDPYKIHYAENMVMNDPEDFFVSLDNYKTIKLTSPSYKNDQNNEQYDNNIATRVRIYNSFSKDIYPRFYSSDQIIISVLSLDVIDGYNSGNDLYIVSKYEENSDNIIYSTNISEGYHDADENLVLHPGDNYWLIKSQVIYPDYTTIKIGYRVMEL